MYPKTYRLGPFHTSDIEIRDIIKAWAAISVAFAIVLGGFGFNRVFLNYVYMSAFTVGIGFLLHELAHKIVAQQYGFFSEFRSFDQMLILALVMSFFGFVFAAPGAVMISGHVDVRRNGKISLAGPMANLLLAVAFLGMYWYYPTTLFSYGFMINTWLGLFNLIPFGNFDGVKILRWNKAAYGFTVGFALLLMALQAI